MLKAVTIIMLLVWLYPDAPSEKQYRELSVSRKITKDESILLALVVLPSLLWGSDFIHHISPAWIALGGAIFLLLPGINIVNPKAFHEKINFSSLLFVAGILGFVGVISSSGIGDIMAQRLLSIFTIEQGEIFSNFMLLNFMTANWFYDHITGSTGRINPLVSTTITSNGLAVRKCCDDSGHRLFYCDISLSDPSNISGFENGRREYIKCNKILFLVNGCEPVYFNALEFFLVATDEYVLVMYIFQLSYLCFYQRSAIASLRPNAAKITANVRCVFFITLGDLTTY